MTFPIVILLILIGVIAGIFSGLIGIGGAIIIIPSLIFLLGMNQYEAQGTSLAVMLPPIGLLAAYNYYKAGALNWKFALIIALAFLIGGYFGSKLALHIPQAILRKILAVILVAVAVKLFLSK
ncbi:sulfite exporter TauE/SafE family protein [Candidatus Sulfidibacterium hydrothermale]|uniref:sulfite exporter TauE/SafE family protein n=1 Tax=Candidatus Sulfidibacterium hydrothermale TaxID=2875962 RepID=UPI001F0A9513|nr:sulfite exporter TauE/SafE family protein [Candidatus Sulfidibacterium hydrothermale]UBM62922.1 sulfite exporter TauE/SafE family protein [Candidatus Sulfidibacterium hydrothermale]